MSLRLSSPIDYENLLNSYDTWLFDCDGVLWRGNQVIDGVAQVLNILRQRGMSSKSPSCLQFNLLSHVLFLREEGSLRYQQCHEIQAKLQKEV